MRTCLSVYVDMTMGNRLFAYFHCPYRQGYACELCTGPCYGGLAARGFKVPGL